MDKKFVAICAGAAFSVALVIAGLFTVTYNKSVTYREQIYESVSALDGQYQRRVDLLTNMVDAIESANKYEQDTYSMIVAGRKNISVDTVDNTKDLINFVVEAYPDLKANDNYQVYMKEMATTENMIRSYSENLNLQIKNYKKFVDKFPNNVILNIMGYEKIDVDYLSYNAPAEAPKNLFKD